MVGFGWRGIQGGNMHRESPSSGRAEDGGEAPTHSDWSTNTKDGGREQRCKGAKGTISGLVVLTVVRGLKLKLKAATRFSNSTPHTGAYIQEHAKPDIRQPRPILWHLGIVGFHDIQCSFPRHYAYKYHDNSHSSKCINIWNT